MSFIPASAAALASAGSGLLDYFGAKQQARDAKRAAAKQMEFQERMSNTAHQREVADLRAAGLNPILSARLGGSSTPSGVSEDVFNKLKGSAASALESRRIYADLRNLEAVNRKLEAETRLTDEQTKFMNPKFWLSAGSALLGSSMFGKAARYGGSKIPQLWGSAKEGFKNFNAWKSIMFDKHFSH